MRPTLFVAWLYITAIACVVVAIGDRSFGWLVGGLVAFAVARYAKTLLTRERGTRHAQAAPRLGFFAVSMLVMFGAMGAIFWLQFSA